MHESRSEKDGGQAAGPTRRTVALRGGMLHAVLVERLTRVLGRDPAAATVRDLYDACRSQCARS
jgi:hypothetical protein